MIIKVALSGFFYFRANFAIPFGERGQAVSALAWHARRQRLAPADAHAWVAGSRGGQRAAHGRQLSAFRYAAQRSR